MATKLKAIQRAWKLKKLLNSNDIEEVTKGINIIVKIYKEHQEEVKNKCKNKDFKDVENVDFNTWAYTQQIRIEQLYNDLKSKYHDLHFLKYQFNAY